MRAIITQRTQLNSSLATASYLLLNLATTFLLLPHVLYDKVKNDISFDAVYGRDILTPFVEYFVRDGCVFGLLKQYFLFDC